MALDPSEEQQIREYLLGNMPPEDLSPLEERLLTDPDFFQELSISEEELIDEYLSDSLSKDDRERFEKQFLVSDDRYRKFRFARNLRRYLDSSSSTAKNTDAVKSGSAEISVKKRGLLIRWWPRNPLLSYSLAAAAVVLIAAVSWIAIRNWRSQQPQSQSVFTAVLTPGQVREAEPTNRISVPKGSDAIRLELVLLGQEYNTYDAVVLNDSGVEVWKEQSLRAVQKDGRRLIDVNVQERLLSSGDYQVRLTGRQSNGSSEPLPSYRFRVLR